VEHLLPTEHYGRYYLYVERQEGKEITVLDVTKAEVPFRVADVWYSTNGRPNHLLVATGTAALVTSCAGSPTEEAQESVRVVSFADPVHPRVTREFNHVTAIARDEARGLIFLANPEGIWVLQEHAALNPAVSKAYKDYVLYNHYLARRSEFTRLQSQQARASRIRFAENAGGQLDGGAGAIHANHFAHTPTRKLLTAFATDLKRAAHLIANCELDWLFKLQKHAGSAQIDRSCLDRILFFGQLEGSFSLNWITRFFSSLYFYWFHLQSRQSSPFLD